MRFGYRHVVREREMPDITMCKNKLCPSKNTCYRFTAPPDTLWQSYADFKPLNPWEDTCGWYIEAKLKEKNS
jgi:hypothetical protein